MFLMIIYWKNTWYYRETSASVTFYCYKY